MPWLFLLLVCLSASVHAQEDNGVVGEPLLDCADSYIEVRFETRTPFQGLVFVEENLEKPECRSRPSHNSAFRNASLRVEFTDCGTQRTFSTIPRGTFITTRVIISFNQNFLTKVDRLYSIQCFYMEMERLLSTKIGVSMPPPQMFTANIPMPVCKYEVLNEGPTGTPVLYTTVGQMVYHKWTCESPYSNTFCMTVHSCSVDDGNGDRVQLLNDLGCAQDKYLLNNLEYITDLMAGREAHVYKYADRENMYFDCEITITIKEPGQEYCPYPECPDPPRRRRFSESTTELSNLTMPNFVIESEGIVKQEFFHRNFDFAQKEFCASTIGAVTFIIVNLGAIVMSIIFLLNSFAHNF